MLAELMCGLRKGLRSSCSEARTSSRRLLGVIAASGLAAAFFGAAPAGAVVNGVPDGNQHPYVGNIYFYDATGAFVGGCSGTLVNQTTVLTADHCVSTASGSIAAGAVTWEVSFDSNTGPSNYPAHYILGTPDPDPAWVPAVKGGDAGFFANEANDLGLIHLDQPATTGWPGIQPAPIAPINALAPYANGNGSNNQLLLQVGYGDERTGAPGQGSSYTYDGVRYQSQWPIKKLTNSLFFGNANPDNAVGYGSPCFGDSGSPLLLNNEVAGVFDFANSNCQNTVGGARVDAGPGRDFLASRGLVP